MKVKILVSVGETGFRKVGLMADISKEWAKGLIAKGYAEAVAKSEKPLELLELEPLEPIIKE